jgi:hypothetical protein
MTETLPVSDAELDSFEDELQEIEAEWFAAEFDAIVAGWEGEPPSPRRPPAHPPWRGGAGAPRAANRAWGVRSGLEDEYQSRQRSPPRARR